MVSIAFLIATAILGGIGGIVRGICGAAAPGAAAGMLGTGATRPAGGLIALGTGAPPGKTSGGITDGSAARMLAALLPVGREAAC